MQDYVEKVCIYFSYKSSALSLFINREVEVGFWTFIYTTQMFITLILYQSPGTVQAAHLSSSYYISVALNLYPSPATHWERDILPISTLYLPNWFTKNSVFSLSGFWLSGAPFVPLIFRQVQMYLLAIFAIPSWIWMWSDAHYSGHGIILHSWFDGIHYKNMPIQIYRKFHLQKPKIFR